jgi:hypothetical protein
MAVLIPALPELLAKLLALQSQLIERNGQYKSTIYTQIVVYLVADAEGWSVKDYWWAAPPPDNNFPGGLPTPPPPTGIKAAGVLTPTQTVGQLTTLAASLISAITAHSGPTYIVQ